MKRSIASRVVRIFIPLAAAVALGALPALAQRQVEALDRGLVAVRTTGTNIFLSWRVLGTDPADLAFNIYRDNTKVNASPITGATNLVDANGSTSATYTVRPVLNGAEQVVGGRAAVWGSQVHTVNLQRPAGGTTPSGDFTYAPNDATVADLDGDGHYEIILKWDPSNAKDNSQSGHTGNVIIDAYKLNGTRLWRLDLGRNIRAGAHYTQILAADFDGDGYGEVAVKTAPNTRDGTGNYIRLGPVASADHNADYRNSSGYVLDGPEYFTVFDGRTGRELATANYNPPRGTTSSWGDNYGNRVDRFNGGVAWLDGQRPSMVFQRGYYTRLTVAAWDWREGRLTQRWFFDSDAGNSNYRGQGNHSIHIGDVTGDGRDDILFGSSAIDADGRALWRNGLGHGDASHLGDLLPSRAGLEFWSVKEGAADGINSSVLVDARTGGVIWGYDSNRDVGRGLAADIDASSPGHEMWSSTTDGVYRAAGTRLSASKPSVNFRVYWDGDLQDELLDGTRLDKWTGNGTTRLITLTGQSCNGTKNTPNLSADILGDWREEVITHNGSNELYIHTTTLTTTHRLYTLMHDPVYRVSVGQQNSSYNQPPHLSFALGQGVANAPQPTIIMVGPAGGVSSSSSGGSVSSSSSPATDCNGMAEGSATLDECGRCIGGNTGLTACWGALQGEDFCSAVGVRESSNGGFLGEGYLNFDNVLESSATFVLESAEGTTHTLAMRFANGTTADRPVSIEVNGILQVPSIPFPGTGAWTTWAVTEIPVPLIAGRNELRLISLVATGGPNLDIIGFVSAGLSAQSCESIVGVRNPQTLFSTVQMHWVGERLVIAGAAPGSRVEVYDLQGQLRTLLGEAGGIVASPPGVYLVRIVNEREVQNYKVVR